MGVSHSNTDWQAYKCLLMKNALTLLVGQMLFLSITGANDSSCNRYTYTKDQTIFIPKPEAMASRERAGSLDRKRSYCFIETQQMEQKRQERKPLSVIYYGNAHQGPGPGVAILVGPLAG